jgi:hypothetical protein
MDYASQINRATDKISDMRSAAISQADDYQQSFLAAASSSLAAYQDAGKKLIMGDGGAIGVVTAAKGVYNWYKGAPEAETEDAGAGAADAAGGGAAGAGGGAAGAPGVTGAATITPGAPAGATAVDATVDDLSEQVVTPLLSGGLEAAGAAAGAVAEGVLSAIPGLGIVAAVAGGIDALVHMLHHNKASKEQQANVNPSTLAAPSQSLISSYSQALPSFDSMKDHAASVTAF